MARWRKRLEACVYAGLGRTKLDGLIDAGLIEAKKEDPANPRSMVFVDLDSVDRYFENLPNAATKILADT